MPIVVVAADAAVVAATIGRNRVAVVDKKRRRNTVLSQWLPNMWNTSSLIIECFVYE